MVTEPSLADSPIDTDLANGVRIGAATQDDDAGRGKVFDLICGGTRVLAVGDLDAGLARDLRDMGCEVVGVTTEELGTLDLPAGLEQGFDVGLLVNTLEQVRDPLTVLRDVKKYLRPDGYLVTRVRNVAHGQVRLSLLGGRFPFPSAGEAVPIRFFTYESMVALIEAAGFAVGAVEREEAEVVAPDDAADADLLESLAAARESRTLQFVAASHPLPWAGLPWLQRRLRELAEQNTAAKQEATDLRQDLAAVNDHVRLLVDQLDAALRRERELRGRLTESHETLLRRDSELLEANRAAHESAATFAAELGKANDQLAEAGRQLAAREYQIAALEHQLAATGQQLAQAADREKHLDEQLAWLRHSAHLIVVDRDALARRLDRLRLSLPGRLYRLARRLRPA